MATSNILGKFSDGYSAIYFVVISGVSISDLSDIDTELKNIWGSEVAGHTVTRQEINKFIDDLTFAEGRAEEWSPNLLDLRELSEKYLTWKQSHGVQVYDQWNCRAICWQFNDKVCSLLWFNDQ